MPNRIIKESICTSDSIDNLSWFEEVFFYRLIVNCDDYGRFDARPAILKSRLFPLKDVTTTQVEDCLNKLVSVGMVLRYEVNAKPYLQMSTWENHQQIRNHKSKYPSPEESDCKYLKSIDINCNQIKSNAPVIQSNPIQSESETESECMLGAKSPQENQNAPPAATMILKDGSLFSVFQCDVDEFQQAYKNIDVLSELEKMVLWCKNNPQKRKTSSGIRKFINGWLAKEDKEKSNLKGDDCIGADWSKFKPSRS